MTRTKSAPESKSRRISLRECKRRLKLFEMEARQTTIQQTMTSHPQVQAAQEGRSGLHFLSLFLLSVALVPTLGQGRPLPLMPFHHWMRSQVTRQTTQVSKKRPLSAQQLQPPRRLQLLHWCLILLYPMTVMLLQTAVLLPIKIQWTHVDMT